MQNLNADIEQKFAHLLTGDYNIEKKMKKNYTNVCMLTVSLDYLDV